MTRSAQLRTALFETIKIDQDRGVFSVLNFFASDPYIRGGCEPWLQTEYARTVCQTLPDTAVFNREVPYPNGQKCDLWFEPKRGLPIWVELKAQRNLAFSGTYQLFKEDAEKTYNQGRPFLDENVVICMALFFAVSEADIHNLRNFRLATPSGSEFACFAYDQAKKDWVGVTDDLYNPHLVGARMVTTFKP